VTLIHASLQLYLSVLLDLSSSLFILKFLYSCSSCLCFVSPFSLRLSHSLLLLLSEMWEVADDSQLIPASNFRVHVTNSAEK
jgi:hypothetical protein